MTKCSNSNTHFGSILFIQIFLFALLVCFSFPNQLQPVIPSAIQFHEHICISFHIDKILHRKNRNSWEQATTIRKTNQKPKPDLYRHQIRMRKKTAVSTEQLCKFWREDNTEEILYSCYQCKIFFLYVLHFKWLSAIS